MDFFRPGKTVRANNIKLCLSMNAQGENWNQS